MHSSAAATAGDDLLAGFQEYLQTEGVSHRTRSAYAADLRDYVRCCGSTLPAAVTASDIERYIGDQTSRGIGRASLRRRLCGIRRFFEFLVTSGALTKNPLEGLVLGAHDQMVLSEQDILSIFRFLRLRSRQVSPRRAMAEELVMMLSVFAGLRQLHIEKLSRSSLEQWNGTARLKLDGSEPVEIDGPVLGHFRAYLRRSPQTSGQFLLSSKSTKTLFAEIAAGLGITLDHRRIRGTYLWLRANPERACGLLSRIEDIHE